MQWTHEQDTALRARVATMSSYAMIAADLTRQFGCVITRNATLGRAHRMGIARKPPKAQQARKRYIRAKGRDQPAAERNGCSLLELTNETCRWPKGDVGTVDFSFCGGMVAEGKPYCPHHCRLAYRQPGQREEQAA